MFSSSLLPNCGSLNVDNGFSVCSEMSCALLFPPLKSGLLHHSVGGARTYVDSVIGLGVSPPHMLSRRISCFNVDGGECGIDLTPSLYEKSILDAV